MTFPAFPSLPGVAFPVRTPIWSTLPQDAISGASSPVALWSYPRWRWTLQWDILRTDAAFAELQALLGLYNQVQGSFGVFRYTDPDDGAAADQRFGTGDGGTTVFQLLRSYGGVAEPVWAPSGSPVIKAAGSVVSAVSVDDAGLVTFAAAPASGAALTWSGAFDWLCRFDDDSYDFTKFMSGLWSQGGVKFTSIKPPPSSS